MTPEFRILANERDITATLRDRLLSLRLTDEAGFKTDDVEIALDDRDGAIALPATGAELDVALGYRETGLIRMGLFVVDEVELSGPPSTMTIRAKAANFVGGAKYGNLQTQKTRAWEDTTLGDIVGAVAAEHGYQPVVAARLAGVELPYVDQTSESDLNLLIRLARTHGGVIKPMSARLCCFEEGAAERADGGAMPILTVRPGDVTSWRVSLTDRSRYRSVRARWHDRARAETVTLEVGSGEPVFEITQVHGSESAARSAAEGALSGYQRGASTVSLTLPGNTEASAERKLSLSGFREGVDGAWVCKRVEHELSDSGFVTRIEGGVPRA